MTFQQWWDEHGQYVRAGGGEYEICFAFAAWNAALDAAAKVPREYAVSLDSSGWGNRFPEELTAIFNASTNMASNIRRLKAAT